VTHAKHLRPQRRIDRWIDNLAVVLALSSIALLSIHPRIIWWAALALSAARIAFTAAYRWKERRAQAEWRVAMDGTDPNVTDR
jgi:hypothetical protein